MFRQQPGRGQVGRGPLSAADIEWLNLQEAIQMSQALEESMRLYEEQNKMAPPDEGLQVYHCLCHDLNIYHATQIGEHMLLCQTACCVA